MAPRERAQGPFDREEITAQTRMALMEERLSNMRDDLSEVKDDVEALGEKVDAVQAKVDTVAGDVALIKAVVQAQGTQSNGSFLTKTGQQTFGGILMAAILYLLQHYGLAPKEQTTPAPAPAHETASP